VAVREIISEVPSLRGRGLGCNYVIYFFVASREVYLRGVINLYFVCNKLCNFLAFILRLCTNIFCEAPPPFARARLQTPFCSFIFTGVVRVSCFAKRHAPFARLAWMMTVKRALAPSASCFNYARLCLQLSRNRTFHPSLSCDGILLNSSEVKLRGAKPLIGGCASCLLLSSVMACTSRR